jgi:hypothetical protein
VPAARVICCSSPSHRSETSLDRIGTPSACLMNRHLSSRSQTRHMQLQEHSTISCVKTYFRCLYRWSQQSQCDFPVSSLRPTCGSLLQPGQIVGRSLAGGKRWSGCASKGCGQTGGLSTRSSRCTRCKGTRRGPSEPSKQCKRKVRRTDSR